MRMARPRGKGSVGDALIRDGDGILGKARLGEIWRPEESFLGDP